MRDSLTGRMLPTHGATKRSEFKAWRNAKDRCYNPKARLYSDYGGRGITMASEWRDSFEAFLTHIGTKPSPSLSLDRIRNNEGYIPGNVRWASSKTQNNNKRGVKITDLDALAIRTWLLQGYTGRQMCALFKLSPAMISSIKTNKRRSL